MEIVKFIIEETSTGFSAYAEDLPVYTTGKSMEELKANIEEAMSLYREEVLITREWRIEYSFKQ